MYNTKHKKPSRWLRFLVLALIFTLLCPAGALAQNSLTVSVQTAGTQVTLQGTTAPNTWVTLLVTKTSNDDKAYIDQLKSNSQGAYQCVFLLKNGDYKAKVSSNGMQQEKFFTVGQQTALLTPPVLSADSTDNVLGKAVDLTFTDNSGWRNAITGITVDGTALSASQYTITAGNLRLLAGVMTTVASHTVAVIATGYDNATVSQNLEAAPTNLGSVKVRVVDNVQRLASEVASLGANYQQPFGEILPLTEVAITEGLTMRGALDKALATRNMKAYGATNYVSGIGPITSADGTRTVTKLSEFNAGAQSGWMVTLNDWFINAGVNSFVVKDGDVVEFCYTCNLGVDIDGDVNNSNTTLKSLASSAGTLSPAFTPATKNYTLTLPAATNIIVTPTAANRTNKVSIQSGDKTYRRTDPISVVDKQVITVTCVANIYKITIAIAPDEQDQDRADEVSTLITALPAVDKIALVDKAQIEAARAAYAALSETQKALVTNLAKLTAAETTLAQLPEEDTTPPVITIKNSSDQIVSEDLTVSIASFSFKVTAQDAKDGTISPSVQLNGTVLVAGTDGSYTCTLSTGSNTITATATDAKGNKAEKKLIVTLKVTLLTPPVLSADGADNVLGKAVDLTFTDNTGWRNAITGITVDGTALSASQYTITAGNLRLLAGVVTTVGSHTIAVLAAGYDNATVSQNLQAAPTVGTVKVRVVDNVQRLTSEVASLGANYRQPFGEILPLTEVAITEGLTMRGALEKALATKNMKAFGATNYVSGIGPVTSADGTRTVTKLSEFNAGMQSGWMVTLNDWFINAGVNSFVVKDGDVVEFCYTCNLGVDIDGDVNNSNTTLKSLASSAGTLSPAFTPATKNYTLTLPAATNIIVTPTAANRTNKVTIQSGDNTYRRTDEISVINKQVITVTCAENIYRITIAIATDEQDQDRADEVSTLITALPAVDMIALVNKAQIEAARAAYAALSDAQKALVTNLTKLTAAEAALAKLVGEDKTPPVITVKDMANQTLNAVLTVTKASFNFQVTVQDVKDGLLSPSVRLVNNTTPAGQSVAPAADGSYTVTLAKGSNTLTVRAVDAAGNSAVQSYTVTYTDPDSDSSENIEQVRAASDKVTEYLNAKGYSSDWFILGQGLTGQTIAPTYLNDMVQTIDEYYEKLNGGEMAKVTDLEKWVLSILAAGGDPRNFDGHDLIETIYNFYVPSSNRDITFQGINGVIFGLIALDAKGYAVPADARYSRDYLISYLLSHQNSNGGWDLGTTGSSDVDITSMTLQALAPYYTRAEVKTAADKAVNWLSDEQRSDGGFASAGTVNSESIAQAVIALCALGIDPTSEDFTKNGKNLLDALLAFQQTDGSFSHTLTALRQAEGSFSHTLTALRQAEGSFRYALSDESGDDMATEQAYLAMIAYDRFVEAGEQYNDGKNSVYYFGSTGTSDTKAPVITTDLMSKTVNTAAYTFTATAIDAVEGAVSVQVKFNGNLVAPATDGSYSVTLTKGASNIITLEAKDSKGNTASASYTLVYSSMLTPPVLSADSADNTLGKAVDLTFTDDLEWRNAITSITVDGTVLSASQYTITAGNLRLLAGVMTTIGSHTIAVIATGYEKVTVSQNLQAAPINLGTVKVRVVDNVQRLTSEVASLGANYRQPFGEILPLTDVAITEGITMRGALEKALATKNIQAYGAANYVSGIGPVTSADGTRTVTKLSEFDAGMQSGWMVTLNDWFINAGVNSFAVKDGDVVEFCYTCNLGVDIDGDVNNSNTTLKSLAISAGTLSPAFTPATKNYTLTLPAATKIRVTPTAANRTNQVTIQSGDETYRRTDLISVVDKQVITVTCAENTYKVTIAIATGNQEQDQDRADEISTLIAALPAVDKITLVDKAQIEAIRAAYAALSETQKALVTNLALLTAAETTLAQLPEEDTIPPVITVKDLTDQTLSEELTVKEASFSFQATVQDEKDGLLIPSVQLVNSTTPDGQTIAPGSDGVYTVTLAEGSNTLTVRTVDAAGNSAEQSYTVTYTPGSDSPGPIEQVRAASDKVTQYLNTSGYTSDWVIIGQGVTGQTIGQDYLNDMVQTIDEYYEKLNSGQMAKVTDLEKWVLSILAAGGNPRDVNGHDLVESIYNFYVPSSDRDITFQGINGVIFGLIALDAKGYEVPADARYSREYLISYLLTHQNSDGGWDLGTTGSSDVDITSMTLQALAPYYTRAEVKTVADKAMNWLSDEQRSDGGFASAGTVNSEAISQAVIALCANGIDSTSEDFTKSSKNLLDALLAFQQTDGSFSHALTDNSGDDMATEQAYLALIAYDRFVQAGEKYNGGKTSVYYFGNTETSDTEAPAITTDLMSKTVNTADYTFTATAIDALEGTVSVQVKFNGDLVAPATDGSYTVTLTEGTSNIITLEAKDSKDNTAGASYTLVYNPGVILVTLIELPASADVEEGETVSLSATVTPNTATDQTLNWSSSDTTVATVDENGKVTGEKEGTATVTAEANDGSGVSAACTVEVSDSSGGGGTQPDTMITVSFTLKGDSVHGTPANHTAFQTWVPKTSVSIAKGSKVYDVFTKVLDDKGIQYDETQNNYIGRIKAPASFGGHWLGEFDNGPNSGWMFTVNGKHPSLGLREYKLKDDDVVVWHYTDDYTKEEDADMDDDEEENGSGSGSGSSGTSSDTPEEAVPVFTNPGVLNETNQDALAVLNNLTADQQAGAALPEDAPQLDPTALTATVLTAADGVQLSVPPGALNNQSDSIRFIVGIGQITTAPQADNAVRVLNPLRYQRQFEMENSGGPVQGDTANFTAPVTLTFPIATGDLPTGITTGQLAVYWWNLDKKDWIRLGGVFDPLSNTLSVPTYHFSTYAVMADTSSVPKRLAGADRFLTANEVAAQGWKAGADNVVLVNANTFADALAAAPLAFKLNAPILLTEKDSLTPSTQEQLQKLGTKKITLIGGTGVISQAIESELQLVYGTDNVQRYGGVDRYETAALLATALGTTGKAVLANGEDGHYSDALAISAYAAYNGIPILFTEAQALPAATAQALKDQKVSSTIVVGGEVVVPAFISNQLPGAVRYAGTDSYATAATIAEGLKLNPNRIYIATGLNFADALTAGNLAAHTFSPLIMVDQTVPQASADYLIAQHEAISDLVIIGGEGIISAEQESALRLIIE